jgi:hypothetical protein
LDVSTRAVAPRLPARQGARETLRHAAWFAPLLAPVGVLQSLLIATPWLTSLEADRQDTLVTLRSDWAGREALEGLLSLGGGLRGWGAITALLVAAWLVVLRARGPLRRAPRSGPPLRGREASVRSGLHLAAVLVGALAAWLVHRGAADLGLMIDAVTTLRPTGPGSLALLFGSQVMLFTALGALAGATLALARMAPVAGARTGALLGLAGLAAAFVLGQVAARRLLDVRFDIKRDFARVVGASPEPQPLLVVALARDRSWVLPMRDGIAGARFEAGAAARAEALLARRRGWTALAVPAERYTIGERLVALDPEGARRAALVSVLRGSQPQAGQALLISLGGAPASDETASIVDALESAPGLHFGPQAVLLLAQARAQLGDRAAAERTIGRIRGGSERQIVHARQGVPLQLNRLRHGRVHGHLAGAMPVGARVGVVAARELFSLPGTEGEISETWLLRVAAAGAVLSDGTFEVAGLPEGEMALVLLLAPDAPTRPAQPLPVISLSPDAPEVDVGRIELTKG